LMSINRRAPKYPTWFINIELLRLNMNMTNKESIIQSRIL